MLLLFFATFGAIYTAGEERTDPFDVYLNMFLNAVAKAALENPEARQLLIQHGVLTQGLPPALEQESRIEGVVEGEIATDPQQEIILHTEKINNFLEQAKFKGYTIQDLEAAIVFAKNQFAFSLQLSNTQAQQMPLEERTKLRDKIKQYSEFTKNFLMLLTATETNQTEEKERLTKECAKILTNRSVFSYTNDEDPLFLGFSDDFRHYLFQKLNEINEKKIELKKKKEKETEKNKKKLIIIVNFILISSVFYYIFLYFYF